MRKITIIAILLIASCQTNIQHKYGHALIRVHDKYIPLYDESFNIIDSIICDIDKDLVYGIQVLEIKQNYAHINADCVFGPSDSDFIEKNGWISLNYLGVNPAAHELVLRKRPSDRSKIQSIIENAQWGDLYEVKDMYKGWVYIDVRINGAQYSGWISPVQLCSNPLSPCC